MRYPSVLQAVMKKVGAYKILSHLDGNTQQIFTGGVQVGSLGR